MALSAPLFQAATSDTVRPGPSSSTSAHQSGVIPPAYAIWLDQVEELQARGKLEEAQLHLGALLDAEPHLDLDAAPDGVAVPALRRLLSIAESLEHLEVQASALTELVRRASDSSASDDPDLLVQMQALAVVRFHLDDLEGARALLEKVHSVREESLPADDPNLIETKVYLADMREQLGDFAGSLKLKKAVFAVLEAQLAADDPELLIAKGTLGWTLLEFGEPANALILFEQVLAIREQQFSADDQAVLDVKVCLSMALTDLGDYEGALVFDEDVHAALERQLPPDHEDLLNAKANLALTKSQLGDLEGAAELEESVHSAMERLYPAEHSDLLRAKSNLARTRSELGDLAGALELERDVHDLLEAQFSEEDPQLLSAKLNLAWTYYRLEDFATAFDHFQAAHDVRERLLPSDDPELLAAKEGLALVKFQRGDLTGAHALFEIVHSARERLLRADHEDLLTAKGNLARSRSMMGDLAGALILERAVYEALKRQLPADHPDVLLALQNLGWTHQDLGELESAFESFRAVHDARKRQLPADHPDLLSAKVSLARNLAIRGDFQSAEVLFDVVYSRRKKWLAADHPSLLDIQSDLAALKFLQADYEGACALLEHVHSAMERLLHATHLDLLSVKESLASARFEIGDFEGAQSLGRQIVTGAPGRVSPLANHSPRFARSASFAELKRLSEQWALNQSQEADSDNLGEEFFAGVEAIRLVATGGYDVARAAEAHGDVAKAHKLIAEVQRELGNAGSQGGSDVIVRRVLELSERRDRLEREMRALLVDKGIELPQPTVAGVSAALSDEEAFLSYIAFPSGDLVAFVVSNEGFHALELGAVSDVVSDIEDWRRALDRPLASENVGQVVELNLSEFRGEPVAPTSITSRTIVATDEGRLGLELREKLLDPCLELFEETPVRLHMVLDDVLHLIPFDALPWKADQRVGDVIEIHFANSTRQLLSGIRALEREGSLVAFGGVDYNADVDEGHYAWAAPPPISPGGTRSGAPKSYGVLNETKSEVEAVQRLFEESLEREDAIVTTGSQATKAKLAELAPKARFLHIATHGYFADELFKSETDVLQEESTRLEFFNSDSKVRGFAPWLLCGLAFAGANRGAHMNGSVPGIMSAEELASLDLSGCELAVLSACETNVGAHRAGAGIQSLQTALFAAGARSTITSLWSVDDAATRQLFELFYAKLWNDGLGKAAALWDAKSEMRAAGFPLKDWAAWVLVGAGD